MTSIRTDAVGDATPAAPTVAEPRAKRRTKANKSLQPSPSQEPPPCDTRLSQPPSAIQGLGVATTQIPFLRPNPAKLSELTGALAQIEQCGVFSNYGPMNTRLEEGLVATVFGAEGACVTVGNATLGLMLAVKQAVGWRPRGRYALMPSFTFAATAHAALWCGLTPLLCDIDADTWLPDAKAEEALLDRYGDEIAVILPNATFGNCLDLARYEHLSTAHDIPVVIDAAASLGSLDAEGRAFGTGCRHPLVYSMHATKSFATAEAGLVYCADQHRIAALRVMGNFGFGLPRSATMPGLNGKLGEVSALLGVAKLGEFEQVAAHRHAMYDLYRGLLPDFAFQRMTGRRIAHQFVSVLLPKALAGQVPEVIAALGREGIGAGHYFVPHIAEQPYFRKACISGELPNTNDISGRIIALPISDFLTPTDVARVSETFARICRDRAVGLASPRPMARAVQTPRIQNEHDFAALRPDPASGTGRQNPTP